ncbi:MAG: hypothetical protein V1663_01045 [archaeon]
MSGEIIYFICKAEESGYLLIKSNYGHKVEPLFRGWGEVLIEEKSRRGFFFLVVEEIRKILLKDLFKG